MQRRRAALSGIVATGLILGLVFGCDRQEPIRTYEAPKDAAPTASAMPEAAPAQPTAGAAPQVTWDVPEGWQEQPGSGMRVATLVIEGGDAPLELTVIPLGLAASDVLDNVNRWRGQVGLPPIEADDLDEAVERLDVDGRPMPVANVVGPSAEGQTAQQIIAAMLIGAQRVWFFKVQAPAERIQRHAAEIDAFLRSIRYEAGSGDGRGAAPRPGPVASDGELPEGHPPIPSGGAGQQEGPMPAGHPPIDQRPTRETVTYDAPPGWHAAPEPGEGRVLTLHSGSDHEAEIAVTKFPGTVGGLLENINRWRRQVGLPPVEDLNQQPLARAEVDGGMAGLLDLSAPGEASDRERMLVMIVPRPSVPPVTWFFQLAGPYDVVERHKAGLMSFAGSVEFVGTQGE